MIDLTVNKEALERNIQKARENRIVIPTYRQMKDPETIPTMWSCPRSSRA